MTCTHAATEVADACIEHCPICQRAEIERLTAALQSCESWIDRWTKHVGSCEGGGKCTCGRTAVLYEAGEALNERK